MNLIDAVEWIQLAQDDLFTAKTMYQQVRKPLEIICYHCAQSIEKLLKGFWSITR